MKILAIDTSNSICSVCLLEDYKVLNEIEISDVKTHSEKLMETIDNVLKRCFCQHLQCRIISLFNWTTALLQELE